MAELRGVIETLEERIVYRNDYATVYDDRVQFPNGHEGTYFRWHWNAPHGVGVVPLIAGKVLLLRIYRYQNRAFVLEIPQGFGCAGNTPEVDARRELLEETGLEAIKLEPLLSFESNIPTHIFTARIDPTQHHAATGAEETESIVEFVELPVEDLTPGKLRTLGVVGPMTMAALLAVRLASE